MTTIITLTSPIKEFVEYFANGAEVMEQVDFSGCTHFWPKGANSECAIYSGRQCIYSCCYTQAFGRHYITSVWSAVGCMYDSPINYDVIEHDLPVLCLENAKVGNFYRFAGGWQRVEKIYQVTDEYMKKSQLWHKNRVTTTNYRGDELDFALRSRDC